jgi:hypothetical protein
MFSGIGALPKPAIESWAPPDVLMGHNSYKLSQFKTLFSKQFKSCFLSADLVSPQRQYLRIAFA